jgi:hypothetical protein
LGTEFRGFDVHYFYRAEESLTQLSIEPLKVHLVELEGAVDEQLDK